MESIAVDVYGDQLERASGVVADDRNGIRTERRILVMDDDDAVRRVVCMMLERLGYTVESTETGEQAVAAFDRAIRREQPFDLVILDLIVHGGMGGTETMRKMKKIDPHARAILSTGSVDKVGDFAHTHKDFAGCLLKPFTMRQLKGMIDEVLPHSG